MTAAFQLYLFIAAAAGLTVLFVGASRVAASIDRDTQARRPRNLSQHADRVQSNGHRGEGIHSFHGGRNGE